MKTKQIERKLTSNELENKKKQTNYEQHHF